MKCWRTWGSVLVIAACWHAAGAETAPSPNEQVVEHDAGIVPQGTVIAKDFDIANDEATAITLKTKGASCGCTTLTLAANTLKPGEKTTVHIGIDTHGKSLGKHSVWARVELSSGPGAPPVVKTIRYALSYALSGIFGLGRDLILVGDVQLGESKTVYEKVEDSSTEGDSEPSLTTSACWLHATLEKNAGGRAIRIALRPPTDGVLGPFQEYVYLTNTTNSAEKAKLTVSGLLKGRSVLSSHQVVLFRTTSGRNPAEIRVACADKRYRITEVRLSDVPDHILCEIRHPRTADTASIGFRLRDDASGQALRRNDLLVEIAYADAKIERARVCVTVPPQAPQAPPKIAAPLPSQ